MNLIILALSLSLPLSHASTQPWTDFLKKIVDINSGSKNLDGIREVKKILIQEFKELGFEVREVALAEGRTVVVAQYANATPTIGFYGHVDTVFPKESDFKKSILTDTEFKGPGAIDMKGGIALFREVIRALQEKSPQQLKTIRILLNDDEEIGSPFSKLALQKESAGLKYGLVFEPGDEKGRVVKSLSGINWLELSITGKAAHAGLEHKKGKNACVELSRILVGASQKTNYNRNFTVNVGTLEGGTNPNIVCERAKAKLDVRYVKPTDLAQLRGFLEKSLKTLPSGFSGEMKTLIEVQSLGEETTKTLLTQFSRAAKALGQSFDALHFGYAADTSHLQNVPGVQFITGIGPYGLGMHSSLETMTLSTFEQRKALVLKWLESQ